MADAEFTITGRTQVDTSGMDKLKDSAQGAKQAVEDLTNAPDATPKVDASGLDGITEATGRVKQSAEEMTAAMDGALSGMDTPTQNAMRALEELLGKYQEMESKLKSGSFEFDFDGEGNVQSLKDVERAIEQVIDAQVMLSDQTSDMDFGGKWGDQVNEDVDKVLNAYNAEVEAAEAAAEKLVEAEEKAQKAAEASADKVIAAYKRKQQQMGRSIDQLKADLEEYKRKMEEAAKAGDKIGQAEAIKGIDDTSRAIKGYEKSVQSSTKGSENLAMYVGNLVRMFATGRIAGDTLAYSIRGIGRSIKGGLASIGFMVIAMEALSVVMSKAVEWFKSFGKKSDEEMKKAGDSFKGGVDKMKESYNGFYDHLQKKRDTKYFNSINDQVIQTEKTITEEYKNQLKLIERQARIKLHGLDVKSENVEYNRDIVEQKIRKKAASENWSQQDLDDKLRENEILRRKELLDIEVEKAETSLEKAEGKSNAIQDQIYKQGEERAKYQRLFWTYEEDKISAEMSSLETLAKKYKMVFEAQKLNNIPNSKSLSKMLEILSNPQKYEGIKSKNIGAIPGYEVLFDEIEKKAAESALGMKFNEIFDDKNAQTVLSRAKNIKEMMAVKDEFPQIVEELAKYMKYAGMNTEDAINEIDVDTLVDIYKRGQAAIKDKNEKISQLQGEKKDADVAITDASTFVDDTVRRKDLYRKSVDEQQSTIAVERAAKIKETLEREEKDNIMKGTNLKKMQNLRDDAEKKMIKALENKDYELYKSLKSEVESIDKRMKEVEDNANDAISKIREEARKGRDKKAGSGKAKQGISNKDNQLLTEVENMAVDVLSDNNVSSGELGQLAGLMSKVSQSGSNQKDQIYKIIDIVLKAAEKQKDNNQKTDARINTLEQRLANLSRSYGKSGN